MSLKINLRLASRKELSFDGDVPAGDLDLEGLDELVQVSGPVRYEFQVNHQGESLLVQGKVSLELSCECSRCLKPFKQAVTLPEWVCLVPLDGEDKALVV